MKNTDPIKDKIVETYRMGKCDSDGKTLPKSKWGRNGKGSAFHSAYYTEKYRHNFAEIYGDKPYNTWPRDENGDLIED